MFTQAIVAVASLVLAGPLTPPAAPVAPTGKTTDQVEPRTPLNQANTPGDASNVFIITQPGSYYLEGNINAAAGMSGISIRTPNISLDLMGFTIQGVAGSQYGIFTPSVTVTQFRIANGHINGFDFDGIGTTRLRDGLLTDLTSSNNGGNGYRVDTGVRFTRCTATSNGARGFLVNRNNMLTDCLADQNGSDGFNLNFINIAHNCLATANGSNGWALGRGNKLTGCYSESNDGHGFNLLVDECVLIECYAYRNGPSVANTGHGFFLNFGVAASRGGHTITDCVAIENDFGFDVNSDGNLLQRNRARGNGTNYTTVAGNSVIVVGLGSITATTGANVNISE